MTCQTIKCKLNTSSLPWFYSRKAANQRSGRCVFCFFCKKKKNGGKRCNTAAGVVCNCVPCWRKSPFAIRRSQAIPVLLWSGVWKDWQTCFDCLWVHLSSVTCPVNHIWGLQTAQQAPTGELMMFSPLWSHSSLSKLNNIPGCHYCLRYNKREKNLHLCCPAYLFGAVVCIFGVVRVTVNLKLVIINGWLWLLWFFNEFYCIPQNFKDQNIFSFSIYLFRY